MKPAPVKLPVFYFPQKPYGIILILVLIALVSCNSQNKVSEWPCYHGSDRSNKSAETGLLTEWPEAGPELMWEFAGLGDGYSSVSIAEDMIFTAGIADSQTCVFALNLDGELLWKKANGAAWSTTMPWARSYTGARSTPTYDKGILYHLGETGRLAAYKALDGEEIWAVDLMDEFEAEMPEYGYAESVLVDKDRLYVRPAGKKAFQVCLDKRDGKLLWINDQIPGAEGYSSPVLMDYGGRRQVLGSSSNSYYAADAFTGKLLWKVDWENQRGLNVPDPVISRDKVFITSGYGKGCMLFSLQKEGDSIVPVPVWQSELLDNHHGGVILHDGYLYGSGSSSRGWFCLDLANGEQMWNADGKGSITFADGMLYTLDERGTMKLVQASPGEYLVKGEFRIPEGGKGLSWAHPVVFGGKLYIRHADRLFAYDIRANNTVSE